MELKEAKILAMRLINKHLGLGWCLEIDSARCRFGICCSSSKRIGLSKHYILLNTPARVTRTVLHEIAHALVGCHEGHSAVWKKMAVSIGSSSERSFNSSNTVIPPDEHIYLYRCPNCGEEITKTYIMRNCKYACSECCDKYNNGEYTLEYVFKFIREK